MASCGNRGPFAGLFTMTVLLLLLSATLAGTLPTDARAESWTDSFPGPGLDSRWVQVWYGQDGSDPAPVKVRAGGGIYAATYTEETAYTTDWHGPALRAQMAPFTDFEVSGTFRCISDELQINRLMIRLLDFSGDQVFAFGWSDMLSTDSKAEVGLYGTSFTSPIYKTEQSYAYANFYDKAIGLVRSGDSLTFRVAGEAVHSGTASQTSIAAVEVSFLKLRDECTNDVLDLASVSVSTTGAAVPGAPTGLSAVAGDRFVRLAWSPPADSGALPVTGYRIYRGTAPGAETYLTAVAGTSFNDTGLTNGIAYHYRVSALNELGEGEKCAAVPATPVSLPDPPTSLQALAGAGYVLLTWSTPADDGGSAIAGYTVYRSTDPTPHLLVALGAVSSHNDTGLSNSQAYHYWVSATNALGEGGLSAEAVAIPGSVSSIPSPPRDLEAAPGDGVVQLTWSAPLSSGNLPLQGYRVYRESAAGTWTLLATVTTGQSHQDTGLTNGDGYAYRVTAFNYLGESEPSAEAMAIPAGLTVPGPPRNLVLVPGNHTVTLNWSAPSYEGGSPLQGYKIFRGNSSGGENLIAQVGLVYTYTDTGLVNNRQLHYKVTAFTVLGEGPAANGTVTPSADPANGTGENNETVIPDWTDNFTLTSSIATIAALAIGIGVAFLYMRGGQPSEEGPDKGVDDEPEKGGAEEEGGEDPDGDLLPEGG